MHNRGHIIVDNIHNLIDRLDNRNRKPAVMEIFRHFQADKAAADNGNPFRRRIIDFCFDCIDVANRPQRINSGIVNTRNRRPNGRSAGTQYQCIVAFGIFFTGFQVLHRYRFCGRIDCRYLVPNLCGNIQRRLELFRRHHEKRFAVFYHTADIIRKPAIRKTDMTSPLKDGNVRRFLQSAQTGSNTCAAGNAAYYNVLTHFFLLICLVNNIDNEIFSIKNLYQLLSVFFYG